MNVWFYNIFFFFEKKMGSSLLLTLSPQIPQTRLPLRSTSGQVDADYEKELAAKRHISRKNKKDLMAAPVKCAVLS